MTRCCEDALAGVLAHEIGHVQLRHGLQAIKKSRITSALTTLALQGAKTFGGEKLGQVTEAFEGSISDITQTLIRTGYSRAAERQADEAAVAILTRVGYDPNALVEMLNVMEKRLRPGILDFASTLIIPELASGAAVLCNVHLNPDPDGVYRQVRLFGVFDDRVLPSLGLGAYIAAHPDAGLRLAPGRLFLGEKGIPLDPKGNAVLRYRGPSGIHRAYSAAAVLQSEIRIRMGEPPLIQDENAFKEKYVFFGFSAPGLYDLRPTPVGGVYPGVEIHATLLDNHLSADFIQKAPPWFATGLIIIGSLVCSAFVSYFSTPAKSMMVSVVFLTLPVFVSFGAYIRGFWLPLVVQEVAVFLTVALALMVNYIIEGRQKRFIKNAFRQYLSPVVIDQLIRNPERLELGGELREISIFFSDVQGFTAISEKLDPKELIHLLNRYLSAMTDIIHEEGGTVDKYEGDAIIAFWNAPLEVSDHAVRVVQAGLRCQSKLAEMRPDFRKQIGTDLRMRVGINTGKAVVGNMGSHTRFDYTMLGDAVNLAARLEGTNKQFGIYTLISRSTWEQMGDAFAVREIARVAVMGRREPVTVYEPMFWEAYRARADLFDIFDKGLKRFYDGQFGPAMDIFSSIRGADPAAAAYTEKCEALMKSPPENWQGVWVMTTIAFNHCSLIYMGGSENVRQKILLISYSIIITGVIILGVLILMMSRNQNLLNDRQERRYQSYLLADQLRQSLDDLTRMARTLIV